jgi:hypothetical protein
MLCTSGVPATRRAIGAYSAISPRVSAGVAMAENIDRSCAASNATLGRQYGGVVQRRGEGAGAGVRVPNGDAANSARRPHCGDRRARRRRAGRRARRALATPREHDQHGNAGAEGDPQPRDRVTRGPRTAARPRLSRGGTGLNLALHDGFDLGWIPAARSAEVRLLDPIAARAVGAAGESGLLVRPDGKPAAVLPGVGAPAVALGHQVGAVAA